MRNARGFSLVEVLVASAILAVVLLAIASLFSTAYSNVGYGGRRTKAVALARQKMEELRDGSFPPSTTGSPETLESIYTRSWAVTVTGAPSQVATVTVTVSWPDAAQGTKQATLTSMMAP
ncbi:MAG: prepilin-type N-terminal cleavage/methylation domain-containing protein [Candidatus Methylomirabilales bacterium]